MASLYCFLLMLELIAVSNTARILGVFPTDTLSHYMTYSRLMKELALRGHYVTVLSLFPEENNVENLNYIELNGSYVSPMMTVEERLALGPIENEFDIIKICLMACESVLNHANLQEALKQDYDLYITEIFGTDCFLSIGYKLGVPTIGIITSVSLPWTNDIIANPDNPSYIPVYFCPYTQSMSFFQRIYNTFMNIIMKLIYEIYSVRPSQQIAEKVFGPLPPLRKLAKNYSLILSNTHISMNHIAPISPQIIEIGGLHIPKHVEPVPKDLKKFLDKSENGVIYFSLGSIAQVETMKHSKLAILIQVLGSLKEDILWKADVSKMPELPSNIKPILWAPQLEVLCHPNVKLFIGHGGLLGLQETTYCGVPMLGIPVFADQAHNLMEAQKKGMAKVLNYKDISVDSFSATINELLVNESYAQQAEYISILFKDRPLHPLDAAVYWIEYVIKFKGAYHLKSPLLNLKWYQYSLLDIVAFLFIIFFLLIIFIVKMYNKIKNKTLPIKVTWPPKKTN